MVELRTHRCAVPGEQHPQVLQPRPHARVVEIDEMRPGVRPQDVADVAVAVQPDGADIAGVGIAALQARQRLLGHRLPCAEQIGGYEIGAQQKGARLMAERARRERFAHAERAHRAYGVDAADEAPDPREHARVLELRRAPAAARIEGDAKFLPPVGMRRGDHRDLALGELARERVLLVALGLRPAARPIELRHHHASLLEPDLVDAVLVAVEAEEAPVRAQAGRGDRVEHPLWRELRIRMRVHGYNSAPWRTRSRSTTCIFRTATWRSSGD